MPLTPRLPAGLFAAGCALAFAGNARAEPSKQQCVAASEEGQSLRQLGKLRPARADFVLCMDPGCPGPVRQDCVERVAEVDRAEPTMIFDVMDDKGVELLRVTLKIDGVLVSSHVDGTPIAVEPGTHDVQFIPASGSPIEESFVVREGEKDRHEHVVIHGTDDVPIAAPADGANRRRVAGMALTGAGAVGLAVGTVLGVVAKVNYDSALSDHCAGSANHCNAAGVSGVEAAHTQAAGSTAGFVIGAAFLGGGIALWATSHGEVRAAPTNAGGTLAFAGSF